MEGFLVDGGELEFSIEGDGLPIVLVHGSVFADPWEPMVGHGDLATKHQVVRYHRRGYGNSTPAEPGRSLANEAADLVALVDHLGLERAHVVGHSLAADIVLEAVMAAPDRFLTMTLLEPGMFTVPAALGLNEALAGVTQIFDAGDHRQAMLLFLGGPRGAEMMAQLEMVLPDGAQEQAVRDAPALFGLDLPAGSRWVLDEEAARALTQPTLLVNGSKTTAVYRESSTAIATLLDDVEQVEIAGSGHFVHLEQPQQVAEALATFLAQYS